jgi:hypothetical protein
MKKIDPFKTVWGREDWDIYINNLELLCVKHKIMKKEFSKRAGVVNAFRTDPQRPSPDTIEKISKEFDLETDWLFLYHEILTPEVKQPEPAYDPHGGYKPDPEKALGVERGTQQWKAFELLSKIYASADQQLIGAIFSNLKSFADAAEQQRENVALKQKVDELDLKLNEAMGQLNQKGIIRLRERRSGADRRRAACECPTAIERRAGGDRRKDVINNGATV